MQWGFLRFLAEPWFVAPWYAVGILAAVWVIYDVARVNTPLKTAMRWAWPIIVVFFSVFGLALYWFTARAPGIGKLGSDEEKRRAHHDFERSMFRRVNGAVIHCVAGDGLGIMTAMVICRSVRTSFWQEFWFEYLGGFLFGWFIFQRKSMMMMTDNVWKALAMAFRAELFSMLTVMAGMGAVMAFVTPLVVTQQPAPWTWAFWGFGMFGLLVGYVFTLPMNWLMVKIGWKHGMGKAEDAQPWRSPAARRGALAAMVVLGVVALCVPAWLFEVRARTPVFPSSSTVAEHSGGGASAGVGAVRDGLAQTLSAAIDRLDGGERSAAVLAIDAAYRAADVAQSATLELAFLHAKSAVHDARTQLWDGDPAAARRSLQRARESLAGFESGTATGAGTSAAPAGAPGARDGYDGALVIDEHGDRIGAVERIARGDAVLNVGGYEDVWGFGTLGGRRVIVPAGALLFGPHQVIGATYVMLAGPHGG